MSESGAAEPPSHHRRDGGYQNPWPSAVRAGTPGSIMRWMLERTLQASVDPPASVLPRVTPAVPDVTTIGDDVVATWLGHSTVLIQCAGLTILTDPVWARRVSPVRFAGPSRWVPPTLPIDALPRIDVVLQSHNHYDHFDVAATRTLARRNPDALWCVPLGMTSAVRRCGVTHVSEQDWWSTTLHDLHDARRVGVQSVRITAVPAQHFSGRGLSDRDRSLWCGWVLEVDGVRVYYAGDSGLHPLFGDIAARTGPFDLTILPIGAYEPRWFMAPVHMNPDEAVEAWRTIAEVQRSKHGVSAPPMLCVHWGTYKLTDEPMDQPPQRAAALWSAAGLPADKLWVVAHGETRRTGRVEPTVGKRAD